MFEYTIQRIVNGWLVSVTTPDKILADKVHHNTEMDAWEMINTITAAHIERLKNASTHTS